MRFQPNIGFVFAACLGFSGAAPGTAHADVTPDSYEAHLSAAKQAAGFDFTGTLARLCVVPSTSYRDGITAGDRALWYAEPAKVFDNL